MSLAPKEIALAIGDLVVACSEATSIHMTRVLQAMCPTCGEEVEELRYFTRPGWGKFNEFRKAWGLSMLEPCGHFISRVSVTSGTDFFIMEFGAAGESYLREWTHIASREGGWPQKP